MEKLSVPSPYLVSIIMNTLMSSEFIETHRSYYMNLMQRKNFASFCHKYQHLVFCDCISVTEAEISKVELHRLLSFLENHFFVSLKIDCYMPHVGTRSLNPFCVLSPLYYGDWDLGSLCYWCLRIFIFLWAAQC